MKISAFLCKSDLVTTEKSEKELKLRGVRFHLVLKTRFFAPNVSIMPPGIFFQEKLVKLQRGIQALNISKCSTYSFLHGQMFLTFGTISP